jgi:hypothetical protein
MLWLIACHAPPDVPAPPGRWSLGETTPVVPGDGLPDDVVVQPSANNLDVVAHDGRVFLAFRTAPSHFASTETVLYVVSGADEQSWDYETAFTMGTDLRECRFLSWDGHLFLYFAVLGTDPEDFEPQGAKVSEYLGPGQWTEPVDVGPPGFIPWRTKVVDGVPYMTGYVGGENIYDADGEPIEISWLTTVDGYTWDAVVPGQRVVETGGGSETDFALLDDGSLVAVTRNEAGDAASGWGSKICTAPADALGAWDCASDPKKYDSPLVFEYADRVWLLGRRNVTDTGDYDLGRRELDDGEETLYYEAAYWQEPKRCSLWEVHPDSRAVSFVLDLPSKGDTCFAGILDLGGGSFAVYDYSSPLEGDDVSWVEGQHGETRIYRSVLSWG